MTFNSIDLDRPVEWPGASFRLAWRDDAHPGLTPLTGSRLIQAELLQWTGEDLADGTVAVGFDFGATYLAIYNALDENGLDIGQLDQRYRRHPIRPASHRRHRTA